MPADLFKEHRDIIFAAERVQAAVDRRPYIGINELCRLRSELGNLIKKHRTSEEEQVLGPFHVGGGFELLPQAAPLVADLRSMWIDYSGHIHQWTLKTIEADREGYGRAVTVRVARLKVMLARVEEELYRPVLKMLASSQSATSTWFGNELR